MEVEEILAPTEELEFSEKARAEGHRLPGTLACTDKRLIFLTGTKRGYSDYHSDDIEHIEVQKDSWLSTPFLIGGVAFIAGVFFLIQNMVLLGGAAVVIGTLATAIGTAIRGEELCIHTANSKQTFRVYTNDKAVEAADSIRSASMTEGSHSAI